MMLSDSSGSISNLEWQFQRDSIAAAFRNPTVNSLFSSSNTVAASLYYWAGDAGSSAGVHEEGVGWTLISSPAEAMAFADLVEATTRPDISTQPRAQTAISRAINQSIPLFENNGFEGARKLIDISGDGTENVDFTGFPWNPNPFPTVPVDLTAFNAGIVDVQVNPVFGWGAAQDAHDAALAADIGINGLVILSGLPGDTALVTDTFGAQTFTFNPPIPQAQGIIDAEVAAVLQNLYGGQTVLEFFYENIIIGAPAGAPPAQLFIADDNAAFADAIRDKLAAELVPEPTGVGLLLTGVLGLALRRRKTQRALNA